MDLQNIVGELERNKEVFRSLLDGLTKEVYLWRPLPEKWNLLEIICHLYDEEREDFRARVKSVLEDPQQPLTPIDPQGWVTERNYMGTDFNEMLNKFSEERDQSVQWLRSLESPQWNNAYQHPKFGPMTAELFLTNWLAHDFLHIRQILRLKFEYLRKQTDEPLTYAGSW